MQNLDGVKSKDAKEAEIKAKTAQMDAIREKIDLYESIISKKLIDHSKQTIAYLEQLLEKSEKSKQEEINKILNKIKDSENVFIQKYSKNNKSSLLTILSHELRMPLNGILGFTDLAKNDDLDGKERKEYLEFVKVNSLQLFSVLDDLMQFISTFYSVSKNENKIN